MINLDNKQLLLNACEELDIEISDTQYTMFDTYMNMLIEWNKKMNLTAITNPQDIILKHFVDSITINTVIEQKDEINVIDVGTGAGFPGIPIKIVNPNMKITLLDSLNKRLVFLKELVETLNLDNIQCVHMRAEEAGKNPLFRQKYDYSFSRAVANLSLLAEYCLPFVNKGGKFISMKGTDIKEEISTAKLIISKLGGEISEVKTIKIPFTDITHTLIIISKLSDTPTAYPRKPNKITKNPI